jgi:hypothetical protein
VIILWYVIYGQPVGRFIKFFEGENRTAEGFSSVSTEVLQQFNLKDILVVHAYESCRVCILLCTLVEFSSEETLIQHEKSIAVSCRYKWNKPFCHNFS